MAEPSERAQRMLAAAKLLTDILTTTCGCPGHYVSTEDLDAATKSLASALDQERAEERRRCAEIARKAAWSYVQTSRACHDALATVARAIEGGAE